MDKILISNSFKNLLQSLGAKDASNLSNISSKAVPVVDTASGSAGTLLGYSTMSTLASVLGGTQPVKTLSSYCIYTGEGTDRYIKITLPGSYYSTGIFLFGMTGAFLATGNIRIGNGNVYMVNIKNIVGEFGSSKVYYSGSEVVIDVVSTNQQIGLYILTNNKNVSVDKYSSYSLSGMTEVTIG